MTELLGKAIASVITSVNSKLLVTASSSLSVEKSAIAALFGVAIASTVVAANIKLS